MIFQTSQGGICIHPLEGNPSTTGHLWSHQGSVASATEERMEELVDEAGVKDRINRRFNVISRPEFRLGESLPKAVKIYFQRKGWWNNT